MVWNFSVSSVLCFGCMQSDGIIIWLCNYLCTLPIRVSGVFAMLDCRVRILNWGSQSPSKPYDWWADLYLLSSSEARTNQFKSKKINFLNAFSWTFWIKNQNSFLSSARSCPPVSVSSSRRFWLLILKCSSTMSVCWFDGPGQSYHGKLVTLQWSANLYLTLRIVRLLKLQSL